MKNSCPGWLNHFGIYLIHGQKQWNFQKEHKTKSERRSSEMDG